MHTLSYHRREAQRTVWVPAEASVGGIEHASDRLRSWAITSGVEPAGEPFVRFELELCLAQLPVGADCAGDPAAGIEVSDSPSVNVLTVEDVNFDASHETLEALDGELLSHLQHERRGPVEFHPHPGALISGALVMPVDLDAAALPPALTFGGNAPEDTLGGHETPAGPQPVRAIAVTSQAGSSGSNVALLAASQLGWHYYNERIVLQAAGSDPEIDEEDVERATHHRSFVERVLESLATMPMASAEPMGMASVPALVPPVVPDGQVRLAVEEVMGSLANRGGVVIDGHGAAVALRGRPDTLSVFIGASAEARTQRLQAAGIEPDEAEKQVHDHDEERKSYYKGVYGVDWQAAETYDLCINMNLVSPAMAASLLVAAVRGSEGDFHRE